MENFSLKLSSCVFLVKHPSGDGDAVYLIKIAAEVLVFIKDYRALVWGVVIFITLLSGFVSSSSGYMDYSRD